MSCINTDGAQDTGYWITVTGDNFPKLSVALYFLQSWPVYSGYPVYNGHLAISQGWPLYTGLFCTYFPLTHLSINTKYLLVEAKLEEFQGFLFRWIRKVTV